MKDILEMATVYWNEFGTTYEVVFRYGAWKILTVVLPILLSIGIVRSAYCYAKGTEIGQFNHSMFSLRLGDKILTLFGGQDETMFKRCDGWNEDRSDRIYTLIPIGSNLIGVIIDVAILGLALALVFLVWPIAALISVTVGPLKICRVHNLRKKAFINKLKGKTASA